MVVTLGKLLTEQEHKRDFWNADNGLFLDLGAYYMVTITVTW